MQLTTQYAYNHYQKQPKLKQIQKPKKPPHQQLTTQLIQLESKPQITNLFVKKELDQAALTLNNPALTKILGKTAEYITKIIITDLLNNIQTDDPTLQKLLLALPPLFAKGVRSIIDDSSKLNQADFNVISTLIHTKGSQDLNKLLHILKPKLESHPNPIIKKFSKEILAFTSAFASTILLNLNTIPTAPDKLNAITSTLTSATLNGLAAFFNSLIK